MSNWDLLWPGLWVHDLQIITKLWHWCAKPVPNTGPHVLPDTHTSLNLITDSRLALAKWCDPTPAQRLSVRSGQENRGPPLQDAHRLCVSNFSWSIPQQQPTELVSVTFRGIFLSGPAEISMNIVFCKHFVKNFGFIVTVLLADHSRRM